MPRTNPKKQTPVEFRGTTFRGRSAKRVRKALIPADNHWRRGEGNQISHSRQSPGSPKI